MSVTSLFATGSGRVDMTVGYTDPVIGVTSWPSTTVSWKIDAPSAGASGAVLGFRLALQPGGLVATGTAPGDSAGAAASDVAARFAAIWYQVMQPDMTLSVATSLDQPSGAVPNDMAVAIAPLRDLAAGSYAFATAAASLGAAFADPATTATLADVVTRYGVDWQALGLAAGERSVDALMTPNAAGLLIPSYAVFVTGGTVAGLVPQGLDPALVLADADNIVLPLVAGIELAVPSTEEPQPADGLSLAEVARRLDITAASLVTANAARPALVAPGFVFTAQGVEVEVPATSPGSDATLDDIALAFRDNGVPFDAVMAAVSNADTPGMFRSGATIRVDRQIIAAGWTLADNATGVAVATLAAANIATVDLFAAGTPIFLTATATTGLGAAPLGALARAYAIEPGDLLRHNAGLAPVASGQAGSAGLPVPGLAMLPSAAAGLRVPYTVRAGQSMSAVAALFLPAAAGGDVSAEEALTEANRALPGTIAGGRTIVVAGQSLATHAGDSFDAVMDLADPPVTIAQFAAAIATDVQALAADALLLCPPAKIAGDAAVSPQTLGTTYGLDPTLLLAANMATRGLIVAGVTLEPSPVADQPTVTTAAADSFNAIVRRFAAAGISVTLGDIVRANAAVDFLASGAVLLLPPSETTIGASFGTGGWHFPDVIFPLRSWITLARDSRLVDPAFRGPDAAPGPAVRVSSPVAAARNTTPERQEDGAVTLDVFAAAIEAAIPGLKLATGRVLSAERDPAPTDVWAVSFVDPGGITQVAIAPSQTVPGIVGLQPLSFALRPLSNTLEAWARVEIKTLDPVTGSWGASYTADYQGVDLEVWAVAWLAGMDLICTAPYAAPAYKVAPDMLGRLLAAKKLLACAVADGLSPILTTQETTGGPIGGAAWTAAREVLYQRLLARLGVAYETTAILQFGATVSSPAAAASARLSGAAGLRDIGDDLRGRQLAAGHDPDAWKVSQLGNAKTPLGATTAGTVSFPLDVAQPSRHRSVALDPIYAVNEIEFGVTPVVDGYDASDWLSFVRSFDRAPPAAFSAGLGKPVVPVPLRAYPDLPALVSQAADTSSSGAIEDAFDWAYVFTYVHQSAAQDQIKLEIEFNRRPPPARRSIEDTSDDLFRALAQYAAVSDTLWQILAGLQAPGASAGDTTLVNALANYAGLAERVAGQWSAWWGVGTCDADVRAAGRPRPAHQGLVPPSRRRRAGVVPTAEEAAAPHEFYHYLATLDAEIVDEAEVYTKLTLQRLDADGTVGWPAITVIRDDGREIPLTGTDPAADMRLYTFPSAADQRVPAFTRLAFRWSLGGLHIARYQNANSAVSVIRNARLLGADAPETCSAFIYRTPQLGFPEPLVPLITISRRLDIGPWTNVPATNPLTALFASMFDGDPAGREIAVAIRYGYTLVASDPPIETLLPVKLHPRFLFDQTGTVASIIAAVDGWSRQVRPVTVGGLWGFDISLYSSTDPALDRPLLELKRVVAPLASST